MWRVVSVEGWLVWRGGECGGWLVWRGGEQWRIQE